MKVGRLYIDQLIIRVPGVTRKQGSDLGEAVAHHLAELKPRFEPRRIDSLSVRIRSGSCSTARIADLIARNIRRSLEQT